MKAFRLPWVVACVGGFMFSSVLHGQDATATYDPLAEYVPGPAQIRVQVEWIEVPHEQLTELLFGGKPAANDAELRKQVAQLVKDGKATMLETMLCIARSGQKATTESIEEFIYPTEYEPPALPDKVEFKNKDDAEQAKVTKRDIAVGPVPTSFETRNLGATLEIEPTLSEDDKYIDLRFVPEIIYHVRNTVWADWKDEHGSVKVQMPLIYTLRLNTSVALAAGQPMLVGALSPKDKRGAPDFTRKLMVFVRADVVRPPR